ncbi:MAG TPA: hypothetical protein VJB69_01735 [Candidatus Paceibacterota bacterium]
MPVKRKTSSETISADIETTATPPSSVAKRQDLSKTAALDILKGQLAQRIAVVFDLLTQEVNSIEIEKHKQKQQEEEENLNLLLAQKKKRAEFEEKIENEKQTFEKEKAHQEVEWRLRADDLQKRETDLASWRKQVETFPQELNQRLAEVIKQTTAELKKDFETEKKLLAQKYDLDLKLLNQQVIALQSNLKLQEKENQSLKLERTRAMDQMKDLAVAVVRGREKDLPSSVEPIP